MTLIKNGEVAYNVGKSSCGKKEIMLSNSEAIGQGVLVSDADIGTTIKTTIKGDNKCHSCGRSHLGVIELRQHWIGKTVHIRPYQVFSVR
jgi:hypothetical protein